MTLLLAVLVGCGASDSDSDGDAGGSCPAELDYNGARYVERQPSKPSLPVAEQIGDAEFTECNGSDDPVPAYRLKGVDEETAFAAQKGGQYFLYVNETVEDPCSVPLLRCPAGGGKG